MIHILIGFALYSFYQYCMYAENIRNTRWLYIVAAIHAVIANLLWVHLIQILDSKEEIFRYGFYWDTILYLPIVLVPLAIFAVRPSVLQSVGMTIIIIGAILFHLGARG
jgi:multidrug transporter EmrE-like cation transporter